MAVLTENTPRRLGTGDVSSQAVATYTKGRGT